MKLSRIYTQSESAFPAILFQKGLNVVFARVRDYRRKTDDAHNLGKTFLTNVIDFCLLADLKPDHAFRKHAHRFGELIFFLELLTSDGKFVTVRRPVTGSRNIAIHVSDESSFRAGMPLDQWTYQGLGVDKAQRLLDGELSLSAIAPYNYRKGLGYFLRRQNDYDDLFRISKFGRGRDLDWKPFMALLLGFDCELVRQKYDVDDQIAKTESNIAAVEVQVGASSAQLDEVKGKIALLEERVRQRRTELDSFRFYDADLEVTQELVERIEVEISQLNQQRYTTMSQIEEIGFSLSAELPFDLAKIRQLFEEAKGYFPDILEKDYARLVEFNRGLSLARKERLESRLVKLRQTLESLNQRLETLDVERSSAAEQLRRAESVEKYRELSRRLIGEEEQLLRLRSIEERLDSTSEMKETLRFLRIQRLELIGQIEKMVSNPPAHYQLVRRLYGEFAREILNVYAILSVHVNGEGNLEFESTIAKDSLGVGLTSEGDGFSYQKMLCVCFDLALLCSFATQSFYKFVYHDGVFESLDDRRKNRMLDAIRNLIASYDLQYILTVIDSDLPRTEEDQKLFFGATEVVRELHDQDDSGRLFPGPAFKNGDS